MATLAVALVALLVASIVGWNAGRSALDEKIRDQVVSTRIDRAHHIEDYFASLRVLLQSQALSPATVEAISGFDDGFDLLENRLANEARGLETPRPSTADAVRNADALRNAADEASAARFVSRSSQRSSTTEPQEGVAESTTGSDLPAAEPETSEPEESTLDDYYDEVFLETLSERSGVDADVEQYVPTEPAVRYLQEAYISDNPASVGNKDALADAGDGSNYSTRHAAYHAGFRKVVQEFELYDLFLIEPESLRIVYSVFKEADYATDLRSGPYAQSQLGAVARAIRNEPVPGDVKITDFATYDPSYGAPAGFLATPLFGPDQGFVGVLAVQIPIERIGDVMTAGGRWADVGMGETGEVYLVGSDRRLRSDSRRFLEDPSSWDEFEGPDMDAVRRHGSTVLFQPAATDQVLSAFAPDQGVTISENYLGEEVISAYAPVNVPGLDWAIIAEITTEEAFAPSVEYRRLVIITAVALAALVTFLAVAMAERFVQPYLSLTRRARAVVRPPDDRGDTRPVDFGVSGQAVESLADRLDELRRRHADAAVSRQRHHQRLLPAVLARRAEHGDLESVDTFSSLTVVSVDTGSLGPDDWHRVVATVEHSAQANDLEIVSIDGRRLVAACGLRQGHLDQLDRACRFAARAIAACGPLARAGIATGPTAFGFVGVGIARGDLWGEAPHEAHLRMLASTEGCIGVSSEMLDRVNVKTVATLPDDMLCVVELGDANLTAGAAAGVGS